MFSSSYAIFKLSCVKNKHSLVQSTMQLVLLISKHTSTNTSQATTCKVGYRSFLNFTSTKTLRMSLTNQGTIPLKEPTWSFSRTWNCVLKSFSDLWKYMLFTVETQSTLRLLLRDWKSGQKIWKQSACCSTCTSSRKTFESAYHLNYSKYLYIN